MARACSACVHPERKSIDAALVAGEPTRAIANRFGLSQTGVNRHAKHAAGKRAPRASGSKPVRQSRARVGNEAIELDFTSFPAAPEERTRFVMRLMAMGLWDTGRTGPQLVKATGLSQGTVDRISAEASRRCKASVDADLVRSRLAVALDEGCELGLEMARTKTVVDEETGERIMTAGDPRGLSGLASCAKAFAPLAGANRETGPSVVVNIAADPTFQQITRTIFDALTPFPEAKRAVMLRLRTAVSERQAEARLLGS